MSKRHQDALGIQQGACNPHAIARALVSALDECRAENVAPDHDVASALICHQLAYLLNVAGIDHGYLDAIKACEALANPVPS